MRLTTFVLLADPQIGGIANDTADYAKQMGIMSNLNQELNNIHTYPFPLNNENITLLGIKRSEYINQPDAVFFAGDLTQYGGSIGLESWAFPTKNAANWQGGEKLWNFRILYDPEHPREGITQLNNCGPVYFSLGNHGTSVVLALTMAKET
ncbi:hypothetical protein CC78DRAFT_206559 [Lojkania enalia]|uniref:Uncharacterized protein n=1 Tax=Lojkania enalia TaxID=147567 RepID=A0A9P4KAY4_9PLEO|nr:hypothetical protein CC78DRAFT_206559 [Didymosphaeria enalia]